MLIWISGLPMSRVDSAMTVPGSRIIVALSYPVQGTDPARCRTDCLHCFGCLVVPNFVAEMETTLQHVYLSFHCKNSKLNRLIHAATASPAQADQQAGPMEGLIRPAS